MIYVIFLLIFANASITKDVNPKKVFNNYTKLKYNSFEKKENSYKKSEENLKTKKSLGNNYNWEQEKKELLEMLNSKDRELRKWINLSISVIIVMSLIIIALLVYFLDKATKIAIVSPYPKSTLKVNLLGPSYRDVITDIDPTIRETANRIEIWEKELLKKGAKKEEAEKILLPYLTHPNNRIKANACKALYHFNSEKALEKLEEMLKSPDVWMRLSSIWALSMIKTENAIELILLGLEDKNERVKRRTLEILRSLLETENIESSLREKIEKNIRNI